MSRRLSLLVPLAAAAVLVVGCEGFKEAMTAHVDTVARAGTQELSVQHLADLLGNSRLPLRKEVAKTLTNVWVDYQLLGQAAAKGDSLADRKALDEALWGILAQAKIAKLRDTLASHWGGDTVTEAGYAANNQVLAARHILFLTQGPNGQPLPPAAVDSIRRKAEAVRAQVTPANFAQMAQRYSQDPGSAQRGGSLGVFPAGAMVPEFAKAVQALKPGQISGLVQTQYGFHIIQRLPYGEAKAEFGRVANQASLQTAESSYVAGVEKNGNIEVESGAAKTAKAVAQDLDAHAKDKTVLATSKAGDLTAARMVQWLRAVPPQQMGQLSQQIQQAPDSTVRDFVKKLAMQELLLRAADSAHVTLDTADVARLYNTFGQIVTNAWQALGVTPQSLADSAKTPAEKSRIAGQRVDGYVDRLVAQQAQFIDVPAPVEALLRARYEYKVNDAGIDRAIERATEIRKKADSTRAAAQPPSAVPLPAPQPQGAQPQPPQGEPAQPPAGQKQP